MNIKIRAAVTAMALSLVLGTVAYAQEDEASSSGGTGMELKYGVEVGSTWSSFARGGDSFTDKQFGFAVGGFAKMQLMGPLGVSAELLYSQQGAANVNPFYYYPDELIFQGDIITVDVDIKTHKLALPLLINITPPDMPGAGDVKPVFYAGVQVDYLMSASVKDYKTINGENELVLGDVGPFPMTYNFPRWDYACVIGTGITFEGDDRGYGIDIKYKMGFSNINYSVFNYISNYYNQNSLLVSFKVGL